MDDPNVYRDLVMHSVVEAIMLASTAEVEGEPACILSSAEILDALAIVVAGLMEGAHRCQTSKGLREQTEAFASNVRLQTKTMQKIYEQTGRRFFQIDPIRSN